MSLLWWPLPTPSTLLELTHQSEPEAQSQRGWLDSSNLFLQRSGSCHSHATCCSGLASGSLAGTQGAEDVLPC